MNDPNFTGPPNIGWNATNMTAANTAMDGTGTVDTIFTADATNGGLLDYISIQSRGTNVATVMRFFVNNGSTNATASNNCLIAEMTCPATTSSNTVALNPLRYTFRGLALPPGYKINATLGTAVAAGFSVAGFGANY